MGHEAVEWMTSRINRYVSEANAVKVKLVEAEDTVKKLEGELADLLNSRREIEEDLRRLNGKV